MYKGGLSAGLVFGVTGVLTYSVWGQADSSAAFAGSHGQARATAIRQSAVRVGGENGMVNRGGIVLLCQA